MRLRHLLWIGFVLAAAVGLRHHRVENDLRRWMPELAAGTGTFVVAGVPRDAPELADVGTRLAALAPVTGILPIEGDGAMRGWLVTSRPRGAGPDGNDLLPSIRAALGADEAQVALGGPPVFAAALDDWSQRGLLRAGAGIVVIGIIALRLATGRWRIAALAAAAVFSSQVALLGLVGWLRQPVDMLVSMAPALAMALGLSFAAHRATRPDAGPALVLSMITSALGLAGFVLVDFAPLRAFAGWGALGVALAWIGVQLLVPAPAPHPDDDEAGPAVDEVATRRHPAGRRIILVAAACLTAMGAASVPLLRLEENPIAYFPGDARIVQDLAALDAELVGMLPFELTLRRPWPDGPDPAASPAPTATALAAMLRESAGIRAVFPQAAPGAGATRVLVLASNDALGMIGRERARWQTWASARGATVELAGVAAQLLRVRDAIVAAARTALLAMLGISALAVGAVAIGGPGAGGGDARARRGWMRMALLGAWVNALPAAALLVALAVSGRAVNLPTLVVGAVATGIAVDDTLHLVMARRRLGSLAAARRACMGACVTSSAAAAAAMLLLATCPFRPTAEFGLLLAASIAVAAVADLLVLPATEPTRRTAFGAR